MDGLQNNQTLGVSNDSLPAFTKILEGKFVTTIKEKISENEM